MMIKSGSKSDYAYILKAVRENRMVFILNKYNWKTKNYNYYMQIDDKIYYYNFSNKFYIHLNNLCEKFKKNFKPLFNLEGFYIELLPGYSFEMKEHFFLEMKDDYVVFYSSESGHFILYKTEHPDAYERALIRYNIAHINN